MKASIYIATSLDGFIARENGKIDWLPSASTEDGGDYGYKKFMDSIDALVMGRKTFETILTFREWPYGKKPVVVLSRRHRSIPKHLPETVEAMSSTPSKLVKILARRGLEHIYVDGGKTIQGFLDAGLIKQLIITRVPVLIGKGIPLFGPLQRDIKLRHVGTQQYSSGLVQSSYEVTG